MNLARFVFLDGRSGELFVDWGTMADQVVSTLRTEAGRALADRTFSDVIGELSTRSDEFSSRWARHDVRLHNTACKTLHNQLIGDIELTGDALQLPDDGLVLIAYSAAPGSPAEEKLSFLATWAAQQRSVAEAAGPAKPPTRPADHT